jgi:hypothetical protein
MATTKRARTTSSTTRNKKAVATSAQETSVRQHSGNLEEAVRFRAYQLFLQRGGRHGHDLEDWLRAEGEIVSHGVAQSA